MDFFQNGVSIDSTISDSDLLAAMDSQTGNRGYVSRGALLAAISEAVAGRAFYAKPGGFDWVPPIGIWRVGPTLKTDFDAQTWMVPTTSVLWSSVSRGNDTTGNGTFATPYKSINKAISMMTGATTIYVEAGIYDRNNCWKATSPQHDCNVIAVGGPVVSSMRWEGGSWTLTTSGTYSTARSTASLVVDKADIDSYGVARRLKKVASQALCEAEVRTWATDGTTVWVHTFDGRSPDANVLVMIDLANGYMAHDKKVFCRGIEFEGGLSGGFAQSSAALTVNTTVVFESCKFSFSKVNGLSAVGAGLCISSNCMAFGNLADGYNYHRGANLVDVKAIEINCTAFSNGDPTDASDNDNGSTAHESCRVVRVGTLVDGTQGPQFADIDASMSWNIGCIAGASSASNLTSQNVGFQAMGTAQVWLDGCTSTGSLAQTSAGPSAQILTRSGSIAGLPVY